jgi:Family of unknown function (DUF5522)
VPSAHGPADRSLLEPHPSRLAPDHPLRAEILAAHAAAVEAGEDSYIDPASGYTALTSLFLLRRGDCCQTGCRHCPYVR